MISVGRIHAVFMKQVKDTAKNMQILILFFIFPVIGAVMTNTVGPEAGSASFFITIFATMHCIITPISTAASIIAEEKEKNTLRVLIMSGVKGTEYLISIGGFVLLATLLTGSTFLLLIQSDWEMAALFMGGMFVESILSVIAGTCIGIYAKNQAAATGIAMPCGMLFAFLPMIASFNDTIAGVSKYLYSQQLAYLFSGNYESIREGSMITIANLMIILTLFLILVQTKTWKEQ